MGKQEAKSKRLHIHTSVFPLPLAVPSLCSQSLSKTTMRRGEGLGHGHGISLLSSPEKAIDAMVKKSKRQVTRIATLILFF